MKKLLCCVALVGLLVAPAMAQAQAQTVVGPALLLHDDGDLGIGAYASFPVPQLHENISISPSFAYFFPDVGDYWELNGDVIYRFPVADGAPVMPFALGGINIARSSFSAFGVSASSTDVGLNLGGGIAIPAESVRPVVGGKFEIHDGTGFILFGGVGFIVG